LFLPSIIGCDDCHKGDFVGLVMLYKERMTNHIYLPVIVLLIGGAGFAVGPLALAWLWAKKFSPQKSGPSKNAIYECGLESEGDAWIKFKAGYYIYAIVFLIFDVEAIFLLPFAVAFGGFTAGEAIEMLMFVLLLVGGLVWACQKNVLAWS
jgi:NADH-quinone oxidoreductase subunit A